MKRWRATTARWATTAQRKRPSRAMRLRIRWFRSGAAMSTTLEHLLSKLQNVRRAGVSFWRATCPAHDDPEPSLEIRMGEAAGHLLLKCHGGCSTAQVLAALQLTWVDLF